MNQVLFDSDIQQREFEAALNVRHGADELVRMLLQEIGGAQRAAADWWDTIRTAAQLGTDEQLSYHWPTGTLRIHRRASETTEDEAPERE